MLKNGGFGCAVVSYPNLLPFLSFIPHSTPDDTLSFYDRFFGEMKAGYVSVYICIFFSHTHAPMHSYTHTVTHLYTLYTYINTNIYMSKALKHWII